MGAGHEAFRVESSLGARISRVAEEAVEEERARGGVAQSRMRRMRPDMSGLSLRGARLSWCGGPLEGAHSALTHTTSTGRQGRLGRSGAVARRGHAISKADVRT
ncbi:hypothetical protein GCM10010340_31580 [Streptomyces griseoloalbus]|nr:hypothetical protein GCM10010340_31580 [Streptomyces albaduncus]